MKAHPSLSRSYVLSKGPAAMALMIASEFGRAANRSEHRDNVLNCYRRARELMGILETILLPEGVCESLKPWYSKASEQTLFAEANLDPSYIQRFGTEAASEFNRIAEVL